MDGVISCSNPTNRTVHVCAQGEANGDGPVGGRSQVSESRPGAPGVRGAIRLAEGTQIQLAAEAVSCRTGHGFFRLVAL
jgi:hypothetical protein